MDDLQRLLVGEIIKQKLINDLAEKLASAAVAGDEKDSDNKLYGLRVVRGPDWTHGNQDGGIGFVGTVVHPPSNLDTENKHVVVQWDIGTKAPYKAKRGVGLDLYVFDTAQLGVRHANITCDGCKEEHIWGYRWKCTACDDFDLCTRCYMTDKHNKSHAFLRMDFNRSTGGCDFHVDGELMVGWGHEEIFRMPQKKPPSNVDRHTRTFAAHR